MAKQNNSLTELQALEGIYEHLSTIDDLAKELGVISTRLRKIEERLKEPMDNNIYNYFRVIFILIILLSALNITFGLLIK